MGKFTDFLKSDAGSTSSSDPTTASHGRSSHDRSGSLSKHNDSIASSRSESLTDGTRHGHDSRSRDTSERLNETNGVNPGHRQGQSGAGRLANDAEAVATGEPGRHHRNHTDRDGDGLDDRSTGNQERLIGANGDFGQSHSSGHPQLSKHHDLSTAEHTHHHLAPVTHEKVKHHETEEIIRERERHDHINHIKHAVVPIHHREVRDEVHHDHAHAPTRIEERHVNSAEDQDTFAAIGARHQDTTHHHDKTHEIVDLGERTRVVEHHHVANVVQPVIEKETHDRHRTHTTIPIHHTTHQAPIIHDSVHHSPISMEDFTKRGGKLDSTTTHSQAGQSILAATECERKVDGPAETLMEKLHLK